MGGELGTNQGGWFYDLLTQAGLAPSTARTVDEFVVRPLEVILVVLGAILVAHFGARAIRRVLVRLSRPAVGRSRSPRAEARTATLVALLATVWRFVVGIVAAAIVLGMLGLNLTPILASATIIGATIGFGAQTLVRDYLSGMLLTVEDQFGIGDTISVNGNSGTVDDVSLRVTRLLAGDGTVWYVPNGDIRTVANQSRGASTATVELPYAPADRHGIDRAGELALTSSLEVAASDRFAPYCARPPEVVTVVGADAGSCTLRITLHTTENEQTPLEDALRRAVLASLLEAGMWPASAPDGASPIGSDTAGG